MTQVMFAMIWILVNHVHVACLPLTALLLGPLSSLGQTTKGISKTSSETASGGPRTALVIGNAKYTSAPLRNPVNDARAISSPLQELGFQVTLLEDAGQKKMKRAIDKFGRTIRDGGVGLFYFSGHGMQVDGRNYLIPVAAFDPDLNSGFSPSLRACFHPSKAVEKPCITHPTPTVLFDVFPKDHVMGDP